MATPSITNVDIGGVVMRDAVYQDEALKFGAAETWLAGTILARDATDETLIPFVKGGTTNGNGVPKAVLNIDVAAEAAGNVPMRVAIAGQFEKNRLVIAADGDASNVDAVVLDALRLYGLIAIDVDELSVLDNQ